MKVVMRVNLGSIDAKAHGLDHTKLQQGMEAEVGKDAGEWLLKEGHAVEASKVVKPPEPQNEVKVVAVAPKSNVLGVPITKDDGERSHLTKAEREDIEESSPSPVEEAAANEAKDEISRMRSKEKLQEIADKDQRPSVRMAAKKRLEEIG